VPNPAVALLGFVVATFAFWAALDILRMAREPGASPQMLSATVALGGGLYLSGGAFVAAEGRSLSASANASVLLVGGIMAFFALRLALRAARQRSVGSLLGAAGVLGLGIALAHALPAFVGGAGLAAALHWTVRGVGAALAVFLGLRLVLWLLPAPAEKRWRRAGAVLAGGLGLGSAELLMALPRSAALASGISAAGASVPGSAALAGLLALLLLGAAVLEAHSRTRKQAQLFRSLVGDAQDLLLLVDARGLVRFSSDSAERLLGWADLRGRPLAGLVHPADVAQLAESGTSPPAARQVLLRMAHRNGERRVLEGSVGPGPRPGDRVLHLLDVTRRVAAEEAATALAARHEAILQGIGEGVLGVGPDGQVDFANPTALTMLGLGMREVVGRPLGEVLRLGLPDGSPLMAPGGSMLGALEAGRSWRAADALLERPQGDALHVACTVAPLRGGAPAGGVVLLVDQSGRRRAEADRRWLAERFLCSLEMVEEAVLIEDGLGRLSYVNRAARELLGVAVGQRRGDGRGAYGALRFATVDGRPLYEGEHPAGEVRPGGRGRGPRERRVETAEGRRIYCLVESVRLGEGGEAPGEMLVLRDVTGVREAQAERLQAQRLESLGVFAGGLAHDFNNVLTVMLGNIALARADLGAESPAYGALLAAETSGRRAARLTGELLTFARGGAPQAVRLELGDLLRECVPPLADRPDLSVRLDLPPDLWQVQADAAQLRQVVEDLVRNAVEAMPSGGRLLVSAANETRAAGDAGPLAAGDYVRLTVRDDGDGIPPEAMGRVFEPFFTTKGDGRGLGLSRCWSIARRHGGHVEIASAVGGGTVVQVHLPRAQGAAGQGPAAPRQAPCRHVLVMDDERDLRSVTAQALRRYGCDVATARDGEEAVALCACELEAGRPFDAAILDLTVPGGMGGCEAVGRIRALGAQTRLIASSGYSDEAAMSDYHGHGFDGVLAKPYSHQELLASLEEPERAEAGSEPPTPRPAASGAVR